MPLTPFGVHAVTLRGKPEKVLCKLQTFCLWLIGACVGTVRRVRTYPMAGYSFQMAMIQILAALRVCRAARGLWIVSFRSHCN